MAETIRDLWDVRITVRCMQCRRVDTGTYAELVREDHWPLTHTGPERDGLCPRCVRTAHHLARYPRGSWFLRP
jgi:hypothetical protein